MGRVCEGFTCAVRGQRSSVGGTTAAAPPHIGPVISIAKIIRNRDLQVESGAACRGPPEIGFTNPVSPWQRIYGTVALTGALLSQEGGGYEAPVAGLIRQRCAHGACAYSGWPHTYRAHTRRQAFGACTCSGGMHADRGRCVSGTGPVHASTGAAVRRHVSGTRAVCVCVVRARARWGGVRGHESPGSRGHTRVPRRSAGSLHPLPPGPLVVNAHLVIVHDARL